MKTRLLLAGVVAWVSFMGFAQGQDVPGDSKWGWVPLERNYPEGTPVTVEIRRSNLEETELEVRVPGYWKRTVNYGGNPHTQIRFPDPVLFGEGFPRLQALEALRNGNGLQGLLGEGGLLSEREPFLKEDDSNWFDFPDGQNASPLSPAKYMQSMRIGVSRGAFPEGLIDQQLGDLTASQMIELGIEPVGARPGIPHLRGLIATSLGSKPGENFRVQVLNHKKMDVTLEHPLVPAGFSGSDEGENFEGYDAPELRDRDFYENNVEIYNGNVPPLGKVQRIGGTFGGSQFNVPLCEVGRPTELRIPSVLEWRIVHRMPFVRKYECIPWDQWISKPSFANGSSLRLRLEAVLTPILPIRTARYLIVTPREFEDELQEFADWKRDKGLSVKFVFVGNNLGDDVESDRDDIDQYLENYYHRNFCHGVYVLLVGDVDRIPGGRSNKVVANPDGNNGDSDHVYEAIEDDDFASLYVGRLSVDDADDLTVQLNKILAYERDPAIGLWPTRVTLAANSQNDNGVYGIDPQFPSKYAGAVNAIADYTNYTDPPTFTVRHAGAADDVTPRATNQEVIDDIGAGRGMVLYRGHGSSTDWVSGWDGTSTMGDSFGSTEINQLDNDKIFPIVYSIACQNNRINQDDCAGENWMSRAGGGSVAYYSASVNSYTDENHERAKGIFKAIYENGITRLGPALAEAEVISSSTYGMDSAWENNTFCYLLLGDPEMTIRRKAVRPSWFPEIIVRPRIDRVHVTILNELKQPLPGLRVNVVLIDRTILNGLTDDNGEIDLEVDPSQIVRYVVVDDDEGRVRVMDSGAAVGTAVSLSDNLIPEGNNPGFRVGGLSTISGGGEVEEVAYFLVSGAGADDNGLFQVSGGSLIFTSQADHESRSAYNVRVRSSHAGGSIEESFIVQVIDDRSEDADGDGLTELTEEEIHGTSDTESDSDEDGLEDGVEIFLADLGFNPALDDSVRIASLEASTGFFTRKSIIEADSGDLIIEKQQDGHFKLQFQLQELDEISKRWLDFGERHEWIYQGGEDKHFFRIRIHK
ncbi:MAG: C25 family cysteine peptidase [Roseibacillus sp.]